MSGIESTSEDFYHAAQKILYSIWLDAEEAAEAGVSAAELGASAGASAAELGANAGVEAGELGARAATAPFDFAGNY